MGEKLALVERKTFGENKLYFSSFSRHLIINIIFLFCTFKSIKNYWIIYHWIVNPMIVQILLGKLCSAMSTPIKAFKWYLRSPYFGKN